MDQSTIYLSTNIPACTAWTILRKRGFSSVRLSINPICRVKVEASQSRTSEGTESDWMSLSSSSVSTSRLEERTHTHMHACTHAHTNIYNKLATYFTHHIYGSSEKDSSKH